MIYDAVDNDDDDDDDNSTIMMTTTLIMVLLLLLLIMQLVVIDLDTTMMAMVAMTQATVLTATKRCIVIQTVVRIPTHPRSDGSISPHCGTIQSRDTHTHRK